MCVVREKKWAFGKYPDPLVNKKGIINLVTFDLSLLKEVFVEIDGSFEMFVETAQATVRNQKKTAPE